MMKHENSAGRDAGPFPGPEILVTPITVEQMLAKALDKLKQAEALFEDLYGKQPIETE